MKTNLLVESGCDSDEIAGIVIVTGPEEVSTGTNSGIAPVSVTEALIGAVGLTADPTFASAAATPASGLVLIITGIPDDEVTTVTTPVEVINDCDAIYIPAEM